MALYSTFIQLTLMSVFLYFNSANELLSSWIECVHKVLWMNFTPCEIRRWWLSFCGSERREKLEQLSETEETETQVRPPERDTVYLSLVHSAKKKVWEPELCYVFCEFNIPKKRKKRKTVKCNFLTFLNLKMVITYSVWLLYEWKRKTRQDEKKMRKENEK